MAEWLILEENVQYNIQDDNLRVVIINSFGGNIACQCVLGHRNLESMFELIWIEFKKGESSPT